MKTTHELLVGARALIADPAHWTQGTYARDAEGTGVDELSDKAVCFCSAGALYRTVGRLSEPLGDPVGEAFKVLNRIALARTHGALPIVAFNDDKPHAEVLAMFDAAIEATKP